MSFAQQLARTVALRQPLEGREGFENGCRLIQATVQPLAGAWAAQMYGAALSETRLLLVPAGACVQVGMGVCVGVQPQDWPDYRVVYVAPWPRHSAAHIRFIPLWERVKRHAD